MESPATAPIYAVPSRGRCSYKQGQWRLGTSKQHPYETDVLVPFIVRGPGIAARSSVGALCANIDLMPTVLELAAGWTKADLQVAPLSSWPLLESPSAHCALRATLHPEGGCAHGPPPPQSLSAQTDGNSMLKLLLPDEALVAPLYGRSAESWRTSFITEYKSVGTCATLRWQLLGLTGRPVLPPPHGGRVH
jgi:hypothetical protein